MKKLIYIIMLSAILGSCTGETKKTTTSEENTIEKNIDCICLWDGVSIKESPDKNGKYISSVSLGETVVFLGETAIDSLDKNREYMKIELSDGTIGWSTQSLFIQDAYTAAIVDFAPIFKRPDILTATQEGFKKMDIVAVSKAKDDWIEVYGNKKKLKGWIRKQAITTNKEDIAVCVLVEKKLKKNNEINKAEIESFLAELPYKNSSFVAFLNEENAKYKAEMTETETNKDVEAEIAEESTED